MKADSKTEQLHEVEDERKREKKMMMKRKKEEKKKLVSKSLHRATSFQLLISGSAGAVLQA
jgi:hypothetical protein